MYDTITYLENSLIQHGTYNDRIYLMKLSQADFPSIINKLDTLAINKRYSKIFAKIPEYALAIFLAKGYEAEAAIPEFYNGKEAAYFLGKYFSQTRRQPQNKDEIDNVLMAAKSKLGLDFQIPTPSAGFSYRECQTADILEITELYKQVFASYPFPIQDPNYIAKTMENNVTYFGVWHGQTLAALASAEMDLHARNAEMTDFATLPEYRGKGLSTFLLHSMENYIRKIGLQTAYTIARSVSYGMNITFAKLGYTFSGTLLNNTNISGSLESMNVWYKRI